MSAHVFRRAALAAGLFLIAMSGPDAFAGSGAPRQTITLIPEAAPVQAAAGTPCTLLQGTRSSPHGTGIVRPAAAQATDGRILALADAQIALFDGQCEVLGSPVTLAKFFASAGVGENETFAYW